MVSAAALARAILSNMKSNLDILFYMLHYYTSWFVLSIYSANFLTCTYGFVLDTDTFLLNILISFMWLLCVFLFL